MTRAPKPAFKLYDFITIILAIAFVIIALAPAELLALSLVTK
jgi:hypothetical protein